MEGTQRQGKLRHWFGSDDLKNLNKQIDVCADGIVATTTTLKKVTDEVGTVATAIVSAGVLQEPGFRKTP